MFGRRPFQDTLQRRSWRVRTESRTWTEAGRTLSDMEKMQADYIRVNSRVRTFEFEAI